MKRLPLVVLVGVAALSVASACGGGAPPPEPPGPDVDSIAAAEAERMRQDSIEQARRMAEEEAERLRRQREADSLAALAGAAEEVRSMLATMIHFDFDRSDIRPGDAGILDEKVRILQANPGLRIRVSGHCDERGSDEYNLALGNRRANATRQYLVSHGIDGGRIETISYGEERPIAMGGTEDAWAQNRRSEFEVTAGGDALMRP